EEAGISPEKIGYIGTHGTSTLANDSPESKTIKLALGDAANTAYVSSTKSMTGHLLGAGGGIEGTATLNALQHQFIPPTI
ncbi:beta-ketoacyl-ACP synthase II, partial [Enterococcus faecalis]